MLIVNVTDLFWCFLEAVLAVTLTDGREKHRLHEMFQNYRGNISID